MHDKLVLWNWKASAEWIAFDWAAMRCTYPYDHENRFEQLAVHFSCGATMETSALIIFSLCNALRGERCLSNLQNVMHFIFTIKIIVFTTVCMKWHTFVTVNRIAVIRKWCELRFGLQHLHPDFISLTLDSVTVGSFLMLCTALLCTARPFTVLHSTSLAQLRDTIDNYAMHAYHIAVQSALCQNKSVHDYANSVLVAQISQVLSIDSTNVHNFHLNRV